MVQKAGQQALNIDAYLKKNSVKTNENDATKVEVKKPILKMKAPKGYSKLDNIRETESSIYEKGSVGDANYAKYRAKGDGKFIANMKSGLDAWEAYTNW